MVSKPKSRQELSVYFFQIIHHPALGKANDLRTALEERARDHQAAGIDCQLDQPCAAMEPTLGLILRFDDLTAFESFRERSRTDSATQTWMSRVAGLGSRPVSTILWEPILSNTVEKQWSHMQVVNFTPGVGHANALIWELRERVEMRHREKLACGLYTSVYSGPQTIALVMGASNVAEVQGWSERNRSDPGFLAFQDRISPLLGAPPQVQLMRTLVRFKTTAFKEMATAVAR
jgi:hypothetical protein